MKSEQNKTAKKNWVAQNSDEIGTALGLSVGEIALMNYKAELSVLAAKAIKQSSMAVAEIVTKSGVARSKVSAVKNGATVSISCDLLIKMLAATGRKIAPPKAA